RLERLVRRCDELIAEEGAEKIVSPLNGDEIMALTGRGPGRWIQEVKDHLLELVLDGELARDDKEAATAEMWRRLAASPESRALDAGCPANEGQEQRP
ncbi:MAG: hypothetical protein KGJ86_20285, partial [Chloroflexota bacterium]|nr:hypothetical protein [Chloroflexota bacterium]